MNDESGPRRRRGEEHWASKLTDAEVNEIRDDYEKRNMSVAAISLKWKTSFHTIRHLVRYSRRPYTKCIPPKQ